jgi:hypothetical protein
MELSLLDLTVVIHRTTLVPVICYLELFKYPLIIRFGAEEL